MILRTLEDVTNTERDVDWGNGRSRRLLVEADGMGFALCDTLVTAGTESLLEYRNHLEACYCIQGEGEIEDMLGNVHELRPGMLYALNEHDSHFLRARTDLRLVSIFNPPIRGTERHSLTPGVGSSY